MKYKCYCGNGVTLNQKAAKLILPDQEMFCSCKCFHRYLLDSKPQTKEMPFMASDGLIDSPSEQWDRITKKKYRSLYEVYVARFFHFSSILFLYEKYTIPVGNQHYTPDFYLPELNMFVEVKGLWGQGSKRKFTSATKKVDIVLLPAYLQRDFAKHYKDI